MPYPEDITVDDQNRKQRTVTITLTAQQVAIVKHLVNAPGVLIDTIQSIEATAPQEEHEGLLMRWIENRKAIVAQLDGKGDETQ